MCRPRHDHVRRDGVNVTVAISPAQWEHFKSAPFLPGDDGSTREQGIQAFTGALHFATEGQLPTAGAP